MLAWRSLLAGLRSGTDVVLLATSRLNLDGNLRGTWSLGVLQGIAIVGDNCNGGRSLWWNLDVRMSSTSDWSIGSNSRSVGY